LNEFAIDHLWRNEFNKSEYYKRKNEKASARMEFRKKEEESMKKIYWELFRKIKTFPISTYKFLKKEKEILEILQSDLGSGNPQTYNDKQLVKAYFIIAKKYAETYLKNKGWKLSYKSKSSIYFVKNGIELRFTDHALPDTPQREYNRSQGYALGSDREIIIEEIYSVDQLKKIIDREIKGI
jgi:hypothetical protein